MKLPPASCRLEAREIQKFTSTIRIQFDGVAPLELENVERAWVDDGILNVVTRGELWTQRHAFSAKRWISYDWLYVEDALSGGPILSPIEGAQGQP